eukprot:scaffold32086_cov183-Amphora_coffeaeformis.AAC.6
MKGGNVVRDTALSRERRNKEATNEIERQGFQWTNFVEVESFLPLKQDWLWGGTRTSSKRLPIILVIKEGLYVKV